MIRTFAAFIIAAIIFHNKSAAAEDHCAAENATLKRLASGVQVDIVGSDIKAEQTFTFGWNVEVRFPESKPVYLVLAIPGDARFETQPEPAPDDLPIASDADEGIRCEVVGGGCFGVATRKRQTETQHQTAARGRSRLQEFAPGETIRR